MSSMTAAAAGRHHVSLLCYEDPLINVESGNYHLADLHNQQANKVQTTQANPSSPTPPHPFRHAPLPEAASVLPLQRSSLFLSQRSFEPLLRSPFLVANEHVLGDFVGRDVLLDVLDLTCLTQS